MNQTLLPYEALLACLETATSQSALARDLGVSQPTVWRWLRSSKRLPAEYVLTAERLYGVSRHLLRPDIYPVDLQPFAPFAENATSLSGKDPCGRQADLHRGNEAEQWPATTSTVPREENRK